MNDDFYYLPAGETPVAMAHPGDPALWDDGDTDAGQFAIVIGDIDAAAVLAIHGDLDALEEFALRILRNVHGARIHHTYPVKISLDQVTEWAGRELTHNELIRLDKAVPNSSIPEAIAVIAGAVRSDDEDDQ